MIYLVEDRDYLKIGHAKDIRSRMNNYITENVYCKLIACKEGTKTDESRLHKLCDKWRYKGE